MQTIFQNNPPANAKNQTDINWQIKLEPASYEDIPALVRLWISSFPSEFKRIFGNKAETILTKWFQSDSMSFAGTFLATMNNRRVGYIQIQNQAEVCLTNRHHLKTILMEQFSSMRTKIILTRFNIFLAHPDWQEDELCIQMIGVAPDYQRRGLASRLMNVAFKEAEKYRFQKINAYILDKNTTSLRLFDKFGFKTEFSKRSWLLRWAIGHSGYVKVVKRTPKLKVP